MTASDDEDNDLLVGHRQAAQPTESTETPQRYVDTYLRRCLRLALVPFDPATRRLTNIAFSARASVLLFFSGA